MGGYQCSDSQFLSFLQNSQAFLGTDMPGSQSHSASSHSFQYGYHLWFQLSFRIQR